MGWGSGVGQLGRERRVEGNAEGPMSLAIAPDGSVAVLDQVNGRILTKKPDGTAREIRIGARAAQDLAIGRDGAMAVLDRLGDKRVDVLGPDGSVRASFPLEGRGIREGGGVTGVFVDGDAVYVERAHASLVRLGDLSGKADEAREEILGRPLRDGTATTHAWIEGKPPADSAFVSVNERSGKTSRFTRQVTPGAPVFGIALLDSDRAGVVYFGLVLGDAASGGPSSIGLYCLDGRSGQVLGSTSLPLSTLPDETFRELAVADGGGVTYLYRTDEGSQLMAADCRSGS
jgi:outer membrane protein assembly factor BamB